MDIQHISTVIETLSKLGFSSSTSRTLLFYACLRQKEFVIKEQMRFGEDTISYQLFFKEDKVTKRLACAYYDTTLKKAVEIGASVINGIDVLKLAKQMAGVNWQMPIESNAVDFDITDKNTWKQEATIEEITTDLEVLSATPEGIGLADLLKYKFWTDSSLQSTISEFSTLKSKYELSQRFYIINGDGITATEAYRFLNNRWMERQIHADDRLQRQHETAQKEIKAVSKGTTKKLRKQSRENA